MKKFLNVCSFLLLISTILISFPSLAYAQTESSDLDIYNGDLIITVDSEEEYAQVVKEINEKNKKANYMWLKALEDNSSPYQEVLFSPVVSAVGFKALSVSHVDWISLLRVAYINFTATVTTRKNIYGAEIIGQIHHIGAHGSTSNTRVTVNYKQHKLIDSARTIAVNYSCRVGVRNSDSGVISYYTRAYYVEFYAGGGARVY